jgi:hypothetical protein
MATYEPIMGVRVYLASGDSFYVLSSLQQVAHLLTPSKRGYAAIGSRMVNPQQVCQLTYEAVPSVEIPEQLDLEAAAA